MLFRNGVVKLNVVESGANSELELFYSVKVAVKSTQWLGIGPLFLTHFFFFFNNLNFPWQLESGTASQLTMTLPLLICESFRGLEPSSRLKNSKALRCVSRREKVAGWQGKGNRKLCRASVYPRICFLQNCYQCLLVWE